VTTEPQPALPALVRYLDVALLLVAAPIMLLIGVPAAGYLAAAGVWIALRAAGVAIDRYAGAAGGQAQELTLRVGYLLGRLFLLALTVIVVRQAAGRDAAIAALAVIVVAYTLQLFLSFLDRPTRSR
jgi:hypothetical protein